MVTLFLTRHGYAQSNYQATNGNISRIDDALNTLTEQGRQQARTLGTYFRVHNRYNYVDPHALFLLTSTLLRTQQTRDEIANEMRIVLTADNHDASSQCNEVRPRGNAHSLNTPLAIGARVRRTIEDTLKLNNRPLLAILHENTNRYFLQTFGVELKRFDHCGLYILEWNNNMLRPREYISYPVIEKIVGSK